MPPQFKSQIFAPWTQRQRHDRPSRRGRGQDRYVADSNGDQMQDVQVLSRVRSTFSGNCQVLLRVRRQKARVVNIVLRALSLITLYILIFETNEEENIIGKIFSGRSTCYNFFIPTESFFENTNIFRRKKYTLIYIFRKHFARSRIYYEDIFRLLGDELTALLDNM